MAAECKACAHPERDRIDAALIRGSLAQTWAEVAEPLQAFSMAALARHARNHVRGRSLAGRAATDSDAVDLVAALVAGVNRLERIAADAEKRGDRNVSIRASAEARAGTLALLDRLGVDADSLRNDLVEDSDLIRAILSAVAETPAYVVAWADALDATGKFPSFADDLRTTASAHLTPKESA